MTKGSTLQNFRSNYYEGQPSGRFTFYLSIIVLCLFFLCVCMCLRLFIRSLRLRLLVFRSLISKCLRPFGLFALSYICHHPLFWPNSWITRIQIPFAHIRTKDWLLYKLPFLNLMFFSTWYRERLWYYLLCTQEHGFLFINRLDGSARQCCDGRPMCMKIRAIERQ